MAANMFGHKYGRVQMVDNEVQPPKISSPIRKLKDVVRIVTVVNAVQLEKASLPMASTDSGRSIDGRLVQPAKASSWSSTTVGGIGTLINAVQSSKQDRGMRSKFGGNVADDNSLQ